MSEYVLHARRMNGSVVFREWNALKREYVSEALDRAVMAHRILSRWERGKSFDPHWYFGGRREREMPNAVRVVNQRLDVAGLYGTGTWYAGGICPDLLDAPWEHTR